MDLNTKIDLLKSEYLLLQENYEDFDRRALQIKGWSVTVAVAGLALGFEKASPALWALSVFSAVLFWVVDAKWRTYQYANRRRILEIEDHFRQDTLSEAVPLQAYNTWWDGYSEYSIRGIYLDPVVMLPHVVVVLSGVLLLMVHYLVGPIV